MNNHSTSRSIARPNDASDRSTSHTRIQHESNKQHGYSIRQSSQDYALIPLKSPCMGRVPHRSTVHVNILNDLTIGTQILDGNHIFQRNLSLLQSYVSKCSVRCPGGQPQSDGCWYKGAQLPIVMCVQDPIRPMIRISCKTSSLKVTFIR